MKKSLILILCVLLFSCDEQKRKVKADAKQEIAQKDSAVVETTEERAEKLKKEGYQTFVYQEGDSTYLMQQYYIVFLKSGDTRSQDSTEAARIQKAHLEHLSKLYEDGHTSLTGPFGDDGEIRGIVVFNTPTQQIADSLANLDPAVKAGRLKVESHPWWVAKGGKLK